MTELERVLLAKLEQIEQRHEQQTEDLRQQLQQQAHSLSALQKVCSAALGSLNSSVNDLNEALEPLTLADPVEAMHTVSHDLTLAAPLPLETGGTTTAWQMQVTLRGLVYAAAATVYGTDTSGEPAWPDRSTRNIMAMWGQALADVATVRHADDDGRLTMREQASRLEWLLKWQLLEKLRRKTGSDWTDRRLAAVDLKWAALDPADSIFTRLAGQTERLVTDKQLAEAVGQAPADTRAWLRAEIIRRFPEQVVAASWSHLTVRGESSGDENVEN